MPIIRSPAMNLRELREWALFSYEKWMKGFSLPVDPKNMRALLRQFSLSSNMLLVFATKHGEDKETLDRLSRDEKLARQVTERMQFLLSWTTYGCPVFSLTQSAMTRFLLTDFGGITLAECRLPFDSFVIELPCNQTTLKMVSPDDGTLVPASRMRINLYEMMKVDEDLNRVWAALRDVHWKVYQVINSPAFHWPTTKSELLIELMAPRFEAHTRQPVSMDTKLEEVISTAVSTSMPDETLQDAGRLEKEDKEALEGAVRIALNAVLYINEVHGAKERLKAQHHPKHEFMGLPQPATWVVGKAISLDIRETDAAASYVERGRPRWHVQSRFIVRGHWRQQPFGPGRASRRLKWIEPFWKGPADAKEAIIRTYETA